MLGETALRVFAELGPWIWMIAGFGLMAFQVFSRGFVVLAVSLAALATGTLAVMGSSGFFFEPSFEQQTGIFMLIFLGTLAIISVCDKKTPA